MSILGRIFKSRACDSERCPHRAESLTDVEAAEGICARCADQFARYSRRGSDAATDDRAVRATAPLLPPRRTAAEFGAALRTAAAFAPYRSARRNRRRDRRP